MTQTGVWVKPNETQANSNSDPVNSSSIWLFKTPIHFKVSIKKEVEGIYCFKSEFSRSLHPLENLGPSAETSLEDLL